MIDQQMKPQCAKRRWTVLHLKPLHWTMHWFLDEARHVNTNGSGVVEVADVEVADVCRWGKRR